MKKDVYVNLLFKAVRYIETAEGNNGFQPPIVYAIRRALKKEGYITKKHFDGGQVWTETRKVKP